MLNDGQTAQYSNIFLTYKQEKLFIKELFNNVKTLDGQSLNTFSKFMKSQDPNFSEDINDIKKYLSNFSDKLKAIESEHQSKISLLNFVDNMLNKILNDCDLDQLGYFQYLQNKYFQLKHKFVEWEKQEDINNF